MQKLKNAVVDKMLTAGLTKAEVDFLLELSHYQDDTGRIYGVYYKDICHALNISNQTFYESMRSLEKKGLINAVKLHNADWDITIHNNDFTDKRYRDGYVSTGHDIFYDKEFKNFKAKEKLLAMQLLKICGASDRSFPIGTAKFYKKYSELLSVAKRTVQKYLCKLRNFFSIGIKEKIYWFTPLKKVFKNKAPADMTLYGESLLKTSFRRNKVTCSNAVKEDIKNNCIKNHEEELLSGGGNAFLEAVERSIRLQNADINCLRDWIRDLNAAFVHKLMLEGIKKSNYKN